VVGRTSAGAAQERRRRGRLEAETPYQSSGLAEDLALVARTGQASRRGHYDRRPSRSRLDVRSRRGHPRHWPSA
jgi:hypothetical protein